MSRYALTLHHADPKTMSLIASQDLTIDKFPVWRLSFEALTQENFPVSMDYPVTLVAFHHPHREVGKR